MEPEPLGPAWPGDQGSRHSAPGPVSMYSDLASEFLTEDSWTQTKALSWTGCGVWSENKSPLDCSGVSRPGGVHTKVLGSWQARLNHCPRGPVSRGRRVAGKRSPTLTSLLSWRPHQ